MASKKKVVAVAVTTVALTASSFGLAQAASKARTVSTKTTRVSIQGIGNPMANDVEGRGQELATVLAALVTKGTITQAQADAITTAVQAAHDAEHANDAQRPMVQMGPKGVFVDKLAITSSTLGIDTPTILNRLKAGDSLATIAGAKKDALIAALVAAETKAIDAAVTAGTLTSANAATLKADLTAHVTAEVNGTMPAPRMGGMMGGKGGRGGHGPMGGSSNGMSGGMAGGIPSTGTNN